MTRTVPRLAVAASVLGLCLLLADCATGVAEKDVAEVYFKLGNAYFDLGEFENAVNAYTQALELDASLARAGYNLAHVYLETGKTAEAKRILLDLLQDDPGNGLLMSTLAWAYYREGDLEEALRVYQQVTDRFPSDPDAIYNTATLLWELEKYDDALAEFLKLYEIDPKRDYLPILSKLFAATDDPESAVRYLELYLADDEKSVTERIDLARLYNETKQYGKAVAMYDEAIDLSEAPSGQVLYERARILLLYIEDYESGVAGMREAVSSGFDDGEAIMALAEELPDDVAFELSEVVKNAGLLKPESEAPVPGETSPGL